MLSADNSIYQDIENAERDLALKDKTEMRGYVYGIHENRKTGIRESFRVNPNHIVINGRKWLMQRAVGGSIFGATPAEKPHNWTINWFGVGNGGANSADPFTPFYTPDQQEELISPLKIFSRYREDFKYTKDGFKKTFEKHDNLNAQMRVDVINSEVVALFHLILDYDDCPYNQPYQGVQISELALYASASEDPDEKNFTMFSRYCMPTKFKSSDDKYTFLWFIYF